MDYPPNTVSLRDDMDDCVTEYQNIFTGKNVAVDDIVNCPAYALHEDVHNGAYIVVLSKKLAVIVPSIDLEFIE